MGPRISEVWQYVKEGKCTICPEMKLSMKKSSNILRHIRRAHPEIYQQISNNRSSSVPIQRNLTDFTMVQQQEMSIQDHNDHEADLSHTIDQLFGTSSMGALFGDSCVKMVRRSHFWSFVQNKKCSLCGETLNSSHASNIRKHFLRKHRNEYDQIIDEQQQILIVQQLITRGTKRKRNRNTRTDGHEDNGNGEAYDANSIMYNDRESLNFSDAHSNEPNNNSFPLLLNNAFDDGSNEGEDDYKSSTNDNHLANQSSSIEIVNGEEIDMSIVRQCRLHNENQSMEQMVDFACLLAQSQLDSEEKTKKEDDTSQLVVDLMRQFYDLGWMSGSGGAMCIRDSYTYVTPSAVQKDRLRAEDIGVYNSHNELIVSPKSGVVSSCISLFWTIFRINDKQNPSRPINAVIHTHSIESNLMASFPMGFHYDQVRLSNEEMLKGIIDRALGIPFSNTQTVLIPVIANSKSEGCPEFAERIENAMLQYPSCSAILVRNHGAFYFGATWEETKIMAEIFEYIFKLTLEKIKFAPRICEQVFFSTAATSSVCS